MAPLSVINAEPPAQDVIATLERALVLARAGDLSSVALAFVHRDGAVSAEWSALPSRPAMLGAISRLAHKTNLDADEG
jgi:hypothetical protein